MNNRPGSALMVGLLAVTICGHPIAAEAQPSSDLPLAAVVGEESILVSQVDWEFAKKFGDREFSPQLRQQLRATILRQLVQQHFVLNRIRQTGFYASDDEVDLEVQRISERLKAIEKPLDAFLSEQNQTLHGLRFNLRWQISWRRYRDHYVTDEILEKEFQANHRQFDGTEIHAAHLLLKAAQNASATDIAAITRQATRIAEAIDAGELSWESAVKQYSQSSTKQQSGDIGWIGIDGPMSNQFTEAAFKLEKGQISPPLGSNFGIHLIKCLDVRQGTIQWYDIKDQLRKATTETLFQLLVNRQRDKTSLRYTGNAPYFDPENGKLVKAKK